MMISVKKFTALIEAMRPHHWIKNILILAPALLFDWKMKYGFPLAVGFAAFSLMASAAYLVNDFFDRDADRSHARNRARPLASGRLSVYLSLTTALALFLSSILLSWYVNENFLLIVIGYAALNMAYNFLLKKIYLVDVLTVAIFYYARVLGGFVLLERWPTYNEFAFFALILLSLSFLKRTAELMEKKDLAQGTYTPRDTQSLLLFGSVTGLSSLAFYLGVEMQNFELAWIAWACSVLLMTWLLRIWWIVWQAKIERDLVWFVLKDKVTYATAVILALLHVYGISS